MIESKKYLEFSQKLGLGKFSSPELFEQVFIHRSYLNEHRSLKTDHNERLEFLGDAVLELVSTEFLYKNYDNPEGELTNWRSALVKGEMLAKVAKDLGLEAYLLLSKGEQKGKGKARSLILANTFEALVGAIYLDQGYEMATKFISDHILIHLEEILAHNLHIDSKSDLQEKSQSALSVTPRYELTSSTGPDHDRVFTVEVFLGEQAVAEGQGKSKQKAEQSAAANALSDWPNILIKLNK
ncbi:ribonuclease III [Candidatus Berkelbacteria bacterium]|nr:ribonuclease III [Candidatus Berkelbacteria bacterium]